MWPMSSNNMSAKSQFDGSGDASDTADYAVNHIAFVSVKIKLFVFS